MKNNKSCETENCNNKEENGLQNKILTPRNFIGITKTITLDCSKIESNKETSTAKATNKSELKPHLKSSFIAKNQQMKEE